MSQAQNPSSSFKACLYVALTSGTIEKTGGEDGSAGSKDHPRDGEPNSQYLIPPRSYPDARVTFIPPYHLCLS